MLHLMAAHFGYLLSQESYAQEAYHANKGIHQLDLNILNGEQGSRESDACVSLLYSVPCLLYYNESSDTCLLCYLQQAGFGDRQFGSL